jgi:ABC-2 type transport system ATP-binding protein
MLDTTDLTKHFGDITAVDSLNINIERGEIFCLLGPNGAGKTTTINLFLNFVAPTKGTVRVNGLDVTKHPLETKKVLAYIPEQVMLYRNLSGLENLEYFTTLGGKNSYSPKDFLDFMKRAGLNGDSAQRRISTYSKGMRQKVGIAIALAKQAEALLLDEPTSGLDPKASYEFSESLRALADLGVAVLMATHDLFRAKEVGTSVGIMKHGRLVETLKTDQIAHADLEALYLEHMRS